MGTPQQGTPNLGTPPYGAPKTLPKLQTAWEPGIRSVLQTLDDPYLLFCTRSEQGLGFQDSGFEVSGSGFEVHGLGLVG